MIERQLKQNILDRWDSGKIIIVTGPRQVGKTTLISGICEEKGDYLFINGDDAEMRAEFEVASESALRQNIGQYKLVFIDEAQRIKDIGLILKILHDRINDVKVIVSGSSALDIADKTNEPLTGRKWHFHLFPISWSEISEHFGNFKAKVDLNRYLIHGTYPEVINNLSTAEQSLKELTNSYLYKDLLHFKGIRKPEILDKLLLAIALQVGSEVNFNELSRTVGVDRQTVEQYISLLEKTFVIFRLQPLSRNVRNEINKGRKIYFYDNGVRNAIIGNFKSMDNRNDKGALWENFLISNRIKNLHYQGRSHRTYFWRTYQQQEIDWIEEFNGAFYAYEFKYQPRNKHKLSKTFIDQYHPKNCQVISRENFNEFLGGSTY